MDFNKTKNPNLAVKYTSKKKDIPSTSHIEQKEKEYDRNPELNVVKTSQFNNDLEPVICKIQLTKIKIQHHEQNPMSKIVFSNVPQKGIPLTLKKDVPNTTNIEHKEKEQKHHRNPELHVKKIITTKQPIMCSIPLSKIKIQNTEQNPMLKISIPQKGMPLPLNVSTTSKTGFLMPNTESKISTNVVTHTKSKISGDNSKSQIQNQSQPSQVVEENASIVDVTNNDSETLPNIDYQKHKQKYESVLQEIRQLKPSDNEIMTELQRVTNPLIVGITNNDSQMEPSIESDIQQKSYNLTKCQQNVVEIVDVDSDSDEESTSSHFDDFYQHFVKYHLNQDGNSELIRTITIARLMETVAYEGTIQCLECDYVTNDQPSMLLHLKNNHPESLDTGVLICKVCNNLKKCHLNVDKFQEHLQLEHKYHYNSFVKADKNWQCTTCESLSQRCDPRDQRWFQYSETYTIYILTHTIHRNQCEDGFYFKYNSNATSCERELLMKCIVCESKFETGYRLQKHMLNHVDYGYKRCSGCPFGFDNELQYQKHLETPDRTADMIKNHDNMFFCTICKTDMEMRSAFDHFHACMCEMLTTETADYQCCICGYMAEDADVLLKHVRLDFLVMEHKFQCKYCQNFFMSRLNLASHVQNSVEQDLICRKKKGMDKC